MINTTTRHLRRVCTAAYRRHAFAPSQLLCISKSNDPHRQLSNYIRNFSNDGHKLSEDSKIAAEKESNDAPEAEASDGVIDPEEYTREVSVSMPDTDGNNSKGRIVKWYFEEGDLIDANDTICDIETDLFTFGMDIEEENGGILKEILVPVGEEKYDPGTPICIIMHKPIE